MRDIPPDQTDRRLRAVFVAAVVGVWLVRVGPLAVWGATGPLLDYDEGVYFSAAALIWKGVLPYRDFVHVHPIGLQLFLLPAASLVGLVGTKAAFALARLSMTLVGAVNALLLGRTLWRIVGPREGCAAVILYASCADAALADRSVFLEPLVNLWGLGLASAVLAPANNRAKWVMAGACAGAAVSTKAHGAVWAIAALTALPKTGRWTAFRQFAVAALATVAVLVGPFALAAPSAFLDMVVRFQLVRPPDGRFHVLDRVLGIWNAGHAIVWLPACAALVGGVIDRSTRSSQTFRLFALAYVLTALALFGSPTYYRTYNVLLVVSACALAGPVWIRLWDWTRRANRGWLVGGSVAALGLAGAALASADLARDGRLLDPRVARFAAELAGRPTPSRCLFTFDPGMGLLAGELPRSGDGAPVVVDAYATNLRDALRGSRGGTFESLQLRPEGQDTIRRRIEQCHYIVLGWFGEGEGYPDRWEWFATRFVKQSVAPGRPDLELWERRSGM